MTQKTNSIFTKEGVFISKLYNTQKNIAKYFEKVTDIKKPQLKIIPYIILGMIEAESVVTNDIVKKLKGDFSVINPFFDNPELDVYKFYQAIISATLSKYNPPNKEIHRGTRRNILQKMKNIQSFKTMFGIMCVALVWLIILGVEYTVKKEKTRKCFIKHERFLIIREIKSLKYYSFQAKLSGNKELCKKVKSKYALFYCLKKGETI